MNQIQQVVHGMNQGGKYSVNPITFPLTQVSIDACRARIKTMKLLRPSASPALARKTLKKLDTAIDQLDCIQFQLDRESGK